MLCGLEITSVPAESYGIFEDDKLSVNVTLLGDIPTGAKLVGSVENMQRRVEPLAPVALTAGTSPQSLQLDITPPAYAP
jgi:hypothetical protein